MSPLDFMMTKHAIERLRERNYEFAKHIDQVCKPSETARKKQLTYEFLHQATEESSFLNNTSFMTRLYEKYGYDNRYSLFVNGKIVFVGVTNERGSYIVTSLAREDHKVKHIRQTNKKWKRDAINK